MMLGSVPIGSTPIGGSPDFYEIDYIEDILTFIPLENRNELEVNYVNNHLEAFKHNQNLHNDYALFALHKIFMFVTYGFIYSCLHRNEKLVQAIFVLASVKPEQREQLLRISSPFTLSLVNERTVFDILPVLGCETTPVLAESKKIVNDRNELAHCSGQMCANFDSDMMKYLTVLENMVKLFAGITQKHLLDINSIDFGATKDVQMDNLKIILSNNYVSQRLVELATPPLGREGLTKRADNLLANYLEDKF